MNNYRLSAKTLVATKNNCLKVVINKRLLYIHRKSLFLNNLMLLSLVLNLHGSGNAVLILLNR